MILFGSALRGDEQLLRYLLEELLQWVGAA